MDGGQTKPNAERAAVKPPQGMSASALDKKIGIKQHARDDAARNLPRHDADDLSDTEKAVIEAVAGAVPPRPRPPEQTNPLFENPRLVQATWNEEFAQALESALRSAGSGGPQRASPIIAGLRAVGADPDFGQEIPRRRLVLVSDLLEHNPQGFSLYVSDADYTAGRASSPNGPPNFARVELRIVPIDRPDNAERQAFAVEAFWPASFDAADVQSVSMDPAP
ncbi:hypothetical protein [Candidatus Viadribacter manganicus]|uniref:Uncharacterized protein n=1 Tax=Candidatus Viadribacter manganicus TaxID=1759059 RepID=A0A1B1AJ03_9PROT|nr:hypothetical protein [Candidatus Viadribacter manganicus]ANP46531.1 hypothetical protein ATE48_11675 [Candidatus Viadribacter manganicus]